MKTFEKVYIMDIDKVSDISTLVMCGSQNWDFYFSNVDKTLEYEVLENVELIAFDTTPELEKFIKSNDIIDYSLEHDKPMVLCCG